jgi:hypothetical protein
MSKARWLALAGTLVVSVGCGSSTSPSDGGSITGPTDAGCTARGDRRNYPSRLADWCQVSLQRER